MFSRSKQRSMYLGLAWLWTGLTAAADPAPVPGHVNPALPLPAIPAPMDAQAIRDLIAQPHASEGMQPELGSLARPG
ncbi:MAG: hypothetical protein VB858_03380, partial [Planctomycetaceae bacterium]